MASASRMIVCAALTLGAFVVTSAATAAPCTTLARDLNWQEPTVTGPKGALGFEEFVDAVAASRVTLLGEQHDSYGQHITQLEVLCRLEARDLAVSTGFEQFQVSFQKELDRFGRGEIDHSGLLETSEYFSRWGFDYRLYQPILDFARNTGIKLVALNAPNEWVRAIRERGLAGLEDDVRFDHVRPAEQSYRERLLNVFEAMGEAHTGSNTERMVDVQLLWDETMAEYAARHAIGFRDRRLVVLAGNGHAAFADAIPGRIRSRIVTGVVSVLQLDTDDPAPQGSAPDYTLINAPLELPPPGRLGVRLKRGDLTRGIEIESVSEGSAAKAAGLVAGEVIKAIDGALILSMDDLRVELWDKKPGDVVSLNIEQDGVKRSVDVTLR